MNTTEHDFEQLSEPHRREIKLHCYRMLGSTHEADDLLQETYIRAWRGFDTFHGGSFRAWLYKIATNACLNAIESRKNVQHLLPDQLVPATQSLRMPDATPPGDVSWLEPYPDSHLAGIADDLATPEARYTAREAVHLAFVAAIQELPPRQRAALLLCDVLGWASAEAAGLLGGSTASINSALQRARETLAKLYSKGRPTTTTRPNAEQQALLDRYLKAWEGHDLDGFVALLKEDATFTMPPWLQWYVGRDTIRGFFQLAWQACPGIRFVSVAANGQPAFAMYTRANSGAPWTAHGIHVLTIENGQIARVTLFLDPNAARIFEAFDLPLTLPESKGEPEWERSLSV